MVSNTHRNCTIKTIDNLPVIKVYNSLYISKTSHYLQNKKDWLPMLLMHPKGVGTIRKVKIRDLFFPDVFVQDFKLYTNNKLVAYCMYTLKKYWLNEGIQVSNSILYDQSH